jgi:hypothetical protein
MEKSNNYKRINSNTNDFKMAQKIKCPVCSRFICLKRLSHHINNARKLCKEHESFWQSEIEKVKKFKTACSDQKENSMKLENFFRRQKKI